MTRQAAPRKNPFVGPVPLQRGQPFFGRDRELEELRNLLVAERIVVLYSPSGAGKTSLIQAGLIERLEQAQFNVLPTITLSRPPGVDGPAEANRYLQSTIASLQKGEINADEATGSALSGMSLLDYLKERPRAPDAPTSDVLIFDQFEQVFTLDPADLKAKTDFFQEVGELLRVEKRWALFSLREEHLAELDPYRRWIPERLATSFRLEYLTPDEARDAICLTARCGGVDVDKKAADLLIKDLSRVRVQRPDGSITEDQGNDIEPLQLQVVCHRLLELLPDDDKRLNRSFVESHGDVSDALREYYAETVARVARKTGVPERDIRTWFDEHLITKQRVRGQVLQGQNESEGLKASAVRALVDANLVSEESARNARWLELAHDRLIDPIIASNRSWYRRHLGPIQQQAQIWKKQDEADGYLITGDALTKAKQRTEAIGDPLNEDELEFLKRSEAKDKAEQTERDLFDAEKKLRQEAQTLALEREQKLRVVLALAAVAFVLAGLALWNLRTANINSIRTLAVLAIAQHLRGDNELGALLARQAYVDESHLIPPASVDEVDPALGQVLGADHFNHVLRGHQGGVLTVSFDDTGNRLVSGGDDGTVRLWDPEHTDGPIETLPDPHRSGASVVVFQEGGSLIASGGDDWAVLLQTSGADGEPTRTLPQANAVRAIVFDPHRNMLITAGAEGCLSEWNLDQPDHLPVCIPPDVTRKTPAIRALAYRPGHQQLFSADTQGNIFCWNMGEPCPGGGDQKATLFAEDTTNAAANWDLAFPPAGDVLLSVGADGTIRLWDPDEPKSESLTLAMGLGFLRSVKFSHDGTWLSTGGDDGFVRLWDLSDVPELNDLDRDIGLPAPQMLRGHLGGVKSVAFEPHNRWLASAGDDGTIRLWELKDQTALAVDVAHVSAIDLGQDRKSLAVAGEKTDPITVWNLDDVKAPVYEVRMTDKPVSTVTALALDSPHERLAWGSMNGKVHLWLFAGTAPPEGLPTSDRNSSRVTDLAFSEDGRWLVASSVDGQIRLWDLTQPHNPPREALLEGANQAVTTVVVGPDGQWLAASGENGVVGVWTNVAQLTAKPVVTFAAHDRQTTDMMIATVDDQPRWLATAGMDGTIKLWPLDQIPRVPGDPPPVPDFTLYSGANEDGGANPKSTPVSGDPSADGAGVSSVAFSRDGGKLAAASADGSVRLWNVSELGDAPHSELLIGDEVGIKAIAFDDHDQLVVGSDVAVRVWKTELSDLADDACQRADRDLSDEEWDDLVGHDTVSELLLNFVEKAQDIAGDTETAKCPDDSVDGAASTSQPDAGTLSAS